MMLMMLMIMMIHDHDADDHDGHYDADAVDDYGVCPFYHSIHFSKFMITTVYLRY